MYSLLTNTELKIKIQIIKGERKQIGKEIITHGKHSLNL